MMGPATERQVSEVAESRDGDESAGSGPEPAGPAIILVEPQLGENIGTAARAMANFGLSDLRVVNPRDGWPSEGARRAASGANHVLERVRIYGSVAEAIADLRFVYATTARSREIAKPVCGPGEAGEAVVRLAATGAKAGYLFGRERIGLTNDEVALADEIVTLPVDPRFASLNVAQAVLVIAYEWRRASLAGTSGLPFGQEREPPAAKEVLLGLFAHLEGALDAAHYFRPPERRGHMVRALRAMLHRALLTDQDVRTLRGVIAALEDRPTRPRSGPQGTAVTQRRGDRQS